MENGSVETPSADANLKLDLATVLATTLNDVESNTIVDTEDQKARSPTQQTSDSLTEQQPVHQDHIIETVSLSPDRLWLIAPCRGKIQGEYTKQRGLDSHGQELWRQVVGPGWLVGSGPQGFWCFAQNDADLSKKLILIESYESHSGLGPHEVPLWKWNDGSSWHIDSSIQVVSSQEVFLESILRQECSEACSPSPMPPISLWLVSPPYMALQGEYRKQEHRKERGQPVWKQVGGNGWIFSTMKGRWFVSDTEAGISVNGGVIASTGLHNGQMPHEISTWQCFHEGTWQVEELIMVTQMREEGEHRIAEQEAKALQLAHTAPERLWLLCPTKPSLQGEYIRQPGRVERGQPVWRQLCGKGILYSNGLGGLWCVATKEADVFRNLGLLQCSSPHGGQLPHEVSGWQYADGSSWKSDKTIYVTAIKEDGMRGLAEQEFEMARRASAAPQHLWLASPIHPGLQGQYTKVAGRMERNQAIWRHVACNAWIYSTNGGRWFVTDREQAIALCGGILTSAGPHHGLYPHEIEQWEHFQENTWQPAKEVCLTTDKDSHETILEDLAASGALKSPSTFWFVTPSTPTLQGQYVSKSDLIIEGQPAWLQVDGTAVVFSGYAQIAGTDCQSAQDARWLMAVSEADAHAGNALVRSTVPHCASPPFQSYSWECLREDEWHENNSMYVTLNLDVFSEALAKQELALQQQLHDIQMLLRQEVEDDPVPEIVKVGSGLTDSRKETCSPNSSFGSQRASPVHSLKHTRPELKLDLNFVKPKRRVDDQLRERVKSEVLHLLSHANLCQDHVQFDVDALVDDCCEAVAAAQAKNTNLEGANLSREVMRTILLGWESLRKNDLTNTSTACSSTTFMSSSVFGSRSAFGSTTAMMNQSWLQDSSRQSCFQRSCNILPAHEGSCKEGCSIS